MLTMVRYKYRPLDDPHHNISVVHFLLSAIEDEIT